MDPQIFDARRCVHVICYQLGRSYNDIFHILQPFGEVKDLWMLDAGRRCIAEFATEDQARYCVDNFVAGEHYRVRPASAQDWGNEPRPQRSPWQLLKKSRYWNRKINRFSKKLNCTSYLPPQYITMPVTPSTCSNNGQSSVNRISIDTNHRENKEPDYPSRTVFVWPLDIGTTRDRARHMLSKYGHVIAIRSFGFGDRCAVEFLDQRHAAACINNLSRCHPKLKAKWTANGQARGQDRDLWSFQRPSQPPLQTEDQDYADITRSVTLKDHEECVNNYIPENWPDCNTDLRIAFADPSCELPSSIGGVQELETYLAALQTTLYQGETPRERMKESNQTRIETLDAEVQSLKVENQKLITKCSELQKSAAESNKEIKRLQQLANANERLVKERLELERCAAESNKTIRRLRQLVNDNMCERMEMLAHMTEEVNRLASNE